MIFTLNVTDTLNFFDTGKNGQYSNTVIHLLGEELCAFLFKRYMTEEESTVCQVFNLPCKQSGKKGKRLDRWIKVIYSNEQVLLYQTEIKTWNSNGIGGISLNVDASGEEINNCGLKSWSDIWKHDNSGFAIPGIDKVLYEMNIPSNELGNHPAFPLLLHWEPLFNKKAIDIKSQICFRQNIKGNSTFQEVKVFSASIYLRHLLTLDKKEIDLPVNEFEQLYKKISKIDSLISLKRFYKNQE